MRGRSNRCAKGKKAVYAFGEIETGKQIPAATGSNPPEFGNTYLLLVCSSSPWEVYLLGYSQLLFRNTENRGSPLGLPIVGEGFLGLLAKNAIAITDSGTTCRSLLGD